MKITAPLAPPSTQARGQARRRLAFAPGRVVLMLAAAGLGWTLPAMWNRQFWWGFALWDGLLLLGFLVDLLRLPKADLLTAERSWSGALAIGVRAQARLRLASRARRTLRLELVDHLPPSERHQLSTLTTTLRADAEAELVYGYTPRERGRIEAGQLYARVATSWRLAERWIRFDLSQPLRVYPDFKQTRNGSLFLARSRQIEQQMRRMRMRGQGSEFESLREHREHDEKRAICWTATARRGRLVVKNYQAERSQAVWIVLDCGRLMRTRTEGFSKLDRAVDAALRLSQLAMFSGDRAALLAYGRGVTQQLPPARGGEHMRRIVEALADVREEAEEADHVRAAAAVLSAQKQRGLVVWITDLAESAMTPEVIEAAGRVAGRHALIFMAVAAPELASAARALPENSTEMFEIVAAQEMSGRREQLLGSLRSRGAMVLEAAPGEVTASVLNSYLRVKERNMV